MKKTAYILALGFLAALFALGIGCPTLKKKPEKPVPVSADSLKIYDSSGSSGGSSGNDDGGGSSAGDISGEVESQQQQQTQQHGRPHRASNGAHSTIAKTKVKTGAIGKAIKTIKNNSPQNTGDKPATTVTTSPVNAAATGQKADTVLKKASLGVFCPPEMELNETRIITVQLKVNKTLTQVKGDIITTEKATNDWKSNNDSSAVIAINLQLYDSVKVYIKYDTADFTISPSVGDIGKFTKINVENGNLWQWNITAVSKNKRSSKITLIVEPHTPPNHDLVPIPSHVIPIIIYFDFWDMIRGWIRYLGEHPEYTIPSVLIPLIVVIYKRSKEKKDKN